MRPWRLTSSRSFERSPSATSDSSTSGHRHPGQLKSFSINADRLRDALADGIEFDGSSVTGFNAVEESDLVARPQADTLAVLPWRPNEQAAARLICDIQTPSGHPYEGDARHVLRRAIQRANAMGFDGVKLAAELEYYLFREPGGTKTVDQGGYFDLTTMDAGSDVRRATVLALDQLGVEVSASHHESGPSQHEIAIVSDDLLGAADDLITTRITVKEYALAAGWHATFMRARSPARTARGCTWTRSSSRTARTRS